MTAAALEPVDLHDLLDAAACLWECGQRMLLDIEKSVADPESLPLASWQRDLRNELMCFGTAHVRGLLVNFAEELHRDWQRDFEAGDFDGPFDWEYVPEWLPQRLATFFNQEQPS